MLVERGYDGGLRTLRRYVREARPAPRHEVFLRVETLPGEQAQVDWGHVGTLAVHGGRRALWVFVIVLGYSRAMWAELVVDVVAASLGRSLSMPLRAITSSVRIAPASIDPPGRAQAGARPS